MKKLRWLALPIFTIILLVGLTMPAAAGVSVADCDDLEMLGTFVAIDVLMLNPGGMVTGNVVNFSFARNVGSGSDVSEIEVFVNGSSQGIYDVEPPNDTFTYVIPSSGAYTFEFVPNLEGSYVIDSGCAAGTPSGTGGTTTASTTNKPIPPCAILDGRLNFMDCGASVAVYQSSDAIVIYGIDPKTGAGRAAVVMAFAAIPANPPAEPLLLGSGENGFTGVAVQIYYMPDGSFQVNTTAFDGRPYSFRWARCVVRDGRLNAWSCEAPVAIYQTNTEIFVFAIHPTTLAGSEVIRVALGDIPTEDPTAAMTLGKGSSGNDVFNLTLQPSGELQVNVTGSRRYEFRWWH